MVTDQVASSVKKDAEIPSLLKIEKSQSIDDIEALYSSLPQTSHGCDLSIPTNLYAAELGAVSALFQFLITWSKSFPNSRLVLHTNETDKFKVYLQNLAGSHYGLLAILLASDIISSDRATSIRRLAWDVAKAEYERMISSPGGLRNGPEILLFCADETTKKFIPQFYYPGADPYGQVLSNHDFVILSNSLVSSLSTYRTIPPSEKLIAHMGTILFELFNNTHRWARTEATGEKIRKSVRGIRLQVTRREHLMRTSLVPLHQAYLNQLSNNDDFELLEVSIFDSGPGLAGRALRRKVNEEISLEAEYLKVIECLKLHATSSDRDHRGIGLLEVMQTLSDANAFLRIRTGRLSLYRNFITDELGRHSTRDEIDEASLWLKDWTTESNSLTRHHLVDGLLFTILIPVSRRA